MLKKKPLLMNRALEVQMLKKKPRHTNRSLSCLLLASLLLTALGWGTPAQARSDDGANRPAAPAVVQTVYLPLLYRYNRTPRPQTVFGVQMYGDSGAGTRFFGPLTQTGAAWVRNELAWAAAEPTNRARDAYRWTSADLTAAAANDGNFHMILTFSHNPGWAASSTNGPIDKVDISEFVEFVAAVVERYDGDGVDDMPGSPVITHYEFYNEPDYKTAPNARSAWGDDPQAYAAMLEAVYPAVKAANPDAKVLFGGLAYDWFQDQGGPFVRGFLDEVLAAGAGDFFDVMTFHQYPPFAASWAAQGPGLYEKVQYVRTLMATHNVVKPIIISESGMHSNDTNNIRMTEELQARYVVELFTQNIAADAQVLIWFSLVDPPEWYPFKNGLVTDEETPRTKKSFDAYRTAVRLLADVRSAAVLTANETGADAMQAYRFRDDAAGRTVYVAWLNPIDTDATATLTITAAAADVTDIYGNVTQLRGNARGKVDVSVGGQPVYIEVYD